MACEDCGVTLESSGNPGLVMMPMMPGRDGKPWELCGRCWLEGRKPMKLGRFKATPISDPNLYDALASAADRTAGMINMDEPKKPKRKRAS